MPVQARQLDAAVGPYDPGRMQQELNTIGYSGPISVEWEDAGMDRLRSAPEALAFVRDLAFASPDAAFDAAFSAEK